MKLRVAGVLLGLACVLVLAGVSMFQDRLLYFPARATVADMASGPLRAWPTPQDFRGLVAEPAGQARGTVVVFHGNGGHAGHRGRYATELAPLGLRVILAEYPGYGPRGGPLGEKSLVDDAEKTIVLAQRLHGGPLLIVGESLGAGVAAAAAARQRDKVVGLLLLTPWDKLVHVAAHHYAWLPVRWLLRDRYDSAAHLASFGRPTIVAVAENDSIIPPRFGSALYESLGNPKRFVLIPGAGHNDWPERVDAPWWRASMAFLLGKAGVDGGHQSRPQDLGGELPQRFAATHTASVRSQTGELEKE